MDNETIKILNILKNYNIKINVDLLSKNKYFMNLYKNIKNILNKLKINDNYNNISKKNILNFKIKDYLKDNDFTSNEINLYITNKIKYCYEFYYENNIIIYFTKKNLQKSSAPKLIIHMFTIIKMLKILFNRDFDKNIQKVTFFETDQKKVFPKKKNNILSPNEINSGLTFLNFHKNGDIILYRKEEILKVLIHELIHSNLIDEKIIFSKNIKNFSNLFCVNYTILLNEAFTESFATIINIFYIHINSKLNNKLLDVMFYNEILYSTYISTKIMNYYDIDNIENVIKNNKLWSLSQDSDTNVSASGITTPRGIRCKNIFPQKTNVFAYYILKNIILKNHIKLGNILSKYDLNNDYKINNEYCVNELIKLILNNVKFLDSKSFIINDKNKSLRMCLYEMKL
jgi:hypothetical protein